MSFIHEMLYNLLRDPYKVLSAAGLKPGQRVLEVGCGPGFFTLPAAEMVGEKGTLFALDVNPLAVEHVQIKIDIARARNACAIQADAGGTRLPGESFDLAFVFGLARPIGGMAKIWDEVHRLLQTGGTLAVKGRPRPPGTLFERVCRQGRLVRYCKVEQKGSELARASHCPSSGRAEPPPRSL
jgi:ubiquinone/menaquinone biosynthesis C-methylase UbiE